MKCEHCGFDFDTVALTAKQSTQTTCPSCGKLTTVKYSFRDSLRDPHGVAVRDPKYVSRPLSIIAYVVFGVLLLAIILALVAGRWP